MAVLVLALVGLVGCAHEERLGAGGSPLTVADTKAVMRDLWSGHNFWIRNVVWTIRRTIAKRWIWPRRQ